MLSGKIIKHDHALDVCFQISGSNIFKDKIEIIGYWINMGFKNSYYIEPGNFDIKIEDLKNWKWLSNAYGLACYRYGTWETLTLLNEQV